jgi:hypothetical protein
MLIRACEFNPEYRVLLIEDVLDSTAYGEKSTLVDTHSK